MRPSCCARCDTPARFVVSAGDSGTFWHRSEAACLVCLPRSREWAEFVGPVTLTPLGEAAAPVQIALFELDGDATSDPPRTATRRSRRTRRGASSRILGHGSPAKSIHVDRLGFLFEV